MIAAVLEPLPQFEEGVSFRRQPSVRVLPEPEDNAFDVPACLSRIREGDEDAARDLMQHLYPLVTKLVRAYLPRRTAEEDLIQTVFMKIFARLDQYSGLVPIERWVCRIAVNTCLNQLQREKIRPEWRFSDLSDTQQHFLEHLATPEEPPSGNGALAAEVVVRLLRLLKPSDRLVIQLLHMEQKSILEIAQITGWSVPMIKVRAFRARKKLKKHLRDLEPAMKSAA
jgi:RNA polymerase sigma-70 factor (ECF subfamily)